MEKTRIQKIIADSGYCSRRRAEEYIQTKVVKVNGRVVSIGDKADAENDIITVNGEKINSVVSLRYIKMYKPRGYVTTMSDKHGYKIITDLLTGINERVYPVGRLDRNSEGIILLTNDGNFANDIMHPRNNIQKRYRVTIPAKVSEEILARLSNGVDMGEGEQSQPCIVNEITSEIVDAKARTVLEFIITEGKNRQIRRMCQAVGLPVSRLRRVSVGGVKLGMLKPGEYADLSKEELVLLKQAIKGDVKQRTQKAVRHDIKGVNVKRNINDNYKKNTGRKQTGNKFSGTRKR